MAALLDYNLSPEALLLQLINYDNSSNLTLDEVTLSAPSPVIDGPRNTTVTVTAKDNSAYSDSQAVFYNRINLSALGPLDFMSESPYDQVSLLAAINTKKRAYLYASDLEEFELNPTIQFGEFRTFNLTARPGSIRWRGQTPITVCFGLPDNLDDFDTLMNVTLPSPGYLLGAAPSL